jgi:hypothetical protein
LSKQTDYPILLARVLVQFRTHNVQYDLFTFCSTHVFSRGKKKPRFFRTRIGVLATSCIAEPNSRILSKVRNPRVTSGSGVRCHAVDDAAVTQEAGVRNKRTTHDRTGEVESLYVSTLNRSLSDVGQHYSSKWQIKIPKQQRPKSLVHRL